ncbi:transmembrane protein 176 [Poecilia formosa]|uniref:Membrane-spanning 4-domains subfamily A member 12-like n=1 Tax=Poecilia formosa TaxID=48698 RepID=A0A087Y104_POEFO|nr:PREDICTED: membrane-spanning 4-domains subfamily A member 12-like [Poecilia formosa]XP_007574686.1 PREDICTED: membrane-spanning 4-domains subfamily A member 12-like [Poecilia formosa]XP_007574687.1 PREDICTED: membrane-spanning 4-domains subfamily A member 12-like [Poecilia formosa]XP_016517561.1 PREDICTED: membrane-spanning 4-domains subfamily A member 12-like [Poecilia formosa]XP_016517562.1 PREDICTED: membrane-spanning 4-domains subfamily A member 12-like [Poecilia formosa]
MSVTISRDLSVQVLDDPNKVKLTDRQQQLHAAIQKGEPKCLGLSQVMLGLMVMTYSLPLHFIEHTHVVNFGVPWWTGLTFIAAGSIAMTLDKHFSVKIVQVCLVTSVAAMVLSAVAVIIYSLDLYKHTLPHCEMTTEPLSYYPLDPCRDKINATKFSKGLKSSLLFFTLVQAVLSAVFCWLLYRQKHIFSQYAAINLLPSRRNETKIMNGK